jgi:butyryl-CoA dehydrogenase
VQIYGGYGYSAEYPVERYYRDSRVNRIFEGTNEINRLLITGMLLKRAAAGHLPLYESARKVVDEVMSSSIVPEPGGPLGPELAALAQANKALLFTAGAAVQKFGDAMKDQQEVLMHLSNMVTEVYGMDTAVQRVIKNGLGDPHIDVVRTFINDAMSRVDFSARQVLAAAADGDTLRTQLGALRRLLRWLPVNTIRARQRIAEFLVDSNSYAL